MERNFFKDIDDKIIEKANEEVEKNVIKTNKEFHNLMENRKKNAEERIKQLKNQAEKDIKNALAYSSQLTDSGFVFSKIEKNLLLFSITHCVIPK